MTFNLRPLAAMAVAGVVSVALAGCTSGTKEVNKGAVGTTSTTDTPIATQPLPSTTSSTAPVAHVGATLSLQGGAEAVTLLQVVDPAHGSDQFTTPDAGKRFVATVFKITDTSSQAGQGDANSDAAVIGSDGQTYTPDFNDVTGCTNFNSGSFQLGPNESAQGCVVFQVPTAVSVAKVQWSPNAGFANDFGEWLVP